jgi:hypothetical protein
MIVNHDGYSSAQDNHSVNFEDYVYSTYIGGGEDDQLRDIVTDSFGNFIVTGHSMSTNFPVKDAFQENFTGGGEDIHGVSGDAVVAKFDQAGDLLWSTYLGGTSNDGGKSILVDQYDNVVVFGNTKSSDFPITNDAYQLNYGGNYDMFIAKFSPTGLLIYSSYLGKTGDEIVNDAEIDSSGNFVISGGTGSSNFPTTLDAEQSTFAGVTDGFLIRLAPDCSSILYSTFLGGSGFDGIDKIAIDKDDNIITSGPTGSMNFPLTENAYQNSKMGEERDFFITKYDPSGQMIYSTYFGGSNPDDCFGVGVDSTGSIIATGRTWSHVSVDTNDNILVSGGVGSDGLPIIEPIQQDFGGGNDLIIMVLSPDGKPIFSSFLGGSGSDHPFEQYYSNEQLYIVGFTNSPDFPNSNDSYQQALNQESDGFIFRFDIQSYLSTLPALESQNDNTDFFSVKLLSISIVVFSRFLVSKRKSIK